MLYIKFDVAKARRICYYNIYEKRRINTKNMLRILPFFEVRSINHTPSPFKKITCLHLFALRFVPPYSGRLEIKMELTIGCHLSASKGYLNMGETAKSIGANTFQFFTRNPRGGKAKDIDENDVKAFLEFMSENGFVKILAHAPYTLNACSAEERTREFAHMTMEDDLRRMEYTPNQMYNFHPGSHVGQGIDAGIEMIANQLNDILKPEMTTCVLLETMAGKGSEVGSRFEEIREIIDRVELKEKMGVCLDTCHVYDAGYDIVNNLDGVLDEFDNIIGIERLKAIHINDSKNPFESHKDRHEKIGEGSIGLEAMTRIINHPRLKELPFYLETPNELDGYEHEIKILRERYNG